MRKKKGFTLIELIAAIAILSIAMISISSAVYSASNISAKNTKKVDTSVFAQNIIQTYKSVGKNNINQFYLGKVDKFARYIYFDNEEELNAEIDNKLPNSRNDKISSSKKFEAYVEFLKVDKRPDSALYNIRICVKVVNLKDANKNESSLVLYLGR